MTARTGGWSTNGAGKSMVNDAYQAVAVDLYVSYLQNFISGAETDTAAMAAVRSQVLIHPLVTPASAGVPLAPAATDNIAGKSATELLPGIASAAPHLGCTKGQRGSICAVDSSSCPHAAKRQVGIAALLVLL
jgi:hypothetical protein